MNTFKRKIPKKVEITWVVILASNFQFFYNVLMSKHNLAFFSLFDKKNDLHYLAFKFLRFIGHDL